MVDLDVLESQEIFSGMEKTAMSASVVSIRPADCLSPEEQVWIGRLLQILRSDKPRLPATIKGILRELSESAAVWGQQ
jgi:hypothetical protein